MEVALLLLLVIPYLVIRYFVIDHDTQTDKDRQRFNQGIQLIQKHQFSEALLYFDQAVVQHPKSAVAYAYRGRCNLKHANYYSAIYDLTHALSLDNTIADAYVDKGIAFYKLEMNQDAFREFDKGVWHQRGQSPDAFRWRALARIQLQQLPQAENDLKRAVALGDENAAFLLNQPPFSRKVLF
ncbi:tetratricopeptide repeat protein [Tellurirhabdus bombi]|uniref:tetratricopeptide repeat protein n=1 Tax=Tellurirhabdus bombi TaxID=2907205 RepID=UPI001F227469|nr:hypothetical protein [Tellurirhabdus bombi]